MNRILFNHRKIHRFKLVSYSRQFSIASNNKSKRSNPIKDMPDSEIEKSVFISQSHDIFTNLAFEDWLYRKFDFTTHHVLMLWTNNPCVVIGRHQNPFSEANTSKLNDNGIILARRNSGGGTVYHDLENINLTFFTPRERYNRNYNLNIITRALFREFQIKADITARDDITLHGNKISGTAAKLGRVNAYHHCTLLVNTNKERLKDALVKDDVQIVSRATSSVRSPVKNLADANYHVNVKQLQSAIGYEYLRTSATELNDGGEKLMMKQKGFHAINPIEEWYPGINETRNEFSSWNWRFGKTPKFTAIKIVQMKSNGNEVRDFELKVNVDGGKVKEIFIVSNATEMTFPVFMKFYEKHYTEHEMKNIIDAVREISIEDATNAIDHCL